MFEVRLPVEPRPNDRSNIKPDPLTLVVSLDKNGRLRLNNEPRGDIGNTELITSSLRNVFKERENNGVFREDTNEIEKTVMIKAPRSSRYGDVVRLVDAVKGAGGHPIGFQLDDLEG